jgi:hypothetical protein
VDHNYKVVRSAIITHNDQIDENPQLTTAVFGKGANSIEHFVLGWHNVHNGIDDIRLAAIDREGTLSNSFISSIAQAGGNGAEIGGNFHFAKMGYGWPELSKVAILWSETMTGEGGERDHGMLRAVRLVPEGDKVLVSAPLDVAELPARTLLDHFDAFLEVRGDGVKAVIQGTGYSEVNPDDPATYDEYSMGDGRVLRLPKEETKLYTATGMYANKVRVASLAVDYRNLVLVPIQFTICNMGTDPIVGGAIEVGGNDWHFSCQDDLVYPNESKTLTVWYHMGDKVENLDYTLTANFVHNNMDAGRHTVGGSVYLDYPDLGISKLQTVAEDRGLRMLQMTLYNISPATLAGNKGRSVHLGFYDDALLEHIQEVTCSTPGVTVNADKTLTISGEEALGLIDAGAFTLVPTFDLGRYLADEAGGKQEVPDAGIRLHAHVWAEEAVDGDGDKVILPEFTANNNTTTVLFPSALALSGEAVSISVEQSLTADGVTEAAVSVRNNSLLRRTSGNLVVTLFGQDGNILEQQQSRNCGSNELIELEGEETRAFTFTFSQNGSRVAAFYGDMFLDAGNARLAALNFEGLQARLADFVPGGGGSAYEYTAPDTTLDTVLVNFMTEDPRATVMVNGQEAVLSHRIGLPLGETTRVNLEVTAADGATTKDYLLQVRRVGGLDPVNSPTFEDRDYTYYFEDFEWFTSDRRVTALIEDWGDATRLVDITLDGVSIGAENYELWDANTLAIRQGFLESLDEGTHDLKVSFDWGWTILTIKLAHRPPTYEVWVGPYPYCLPEDCFPNAAAGYGEQAAREILIVNMGTGTVENLTAALTDGSAFEISTPLSTESITPHGSDTGRATLSIRPRTGLAVGNYTDTLTITGSNDIFETLELFFTVEEAPPADKILRSITAPAAITGVANGTAKTAVDLGLPDAVELVTDDGNISASVNAEINWNVAGSSYDPDNTSGQTFIVGGTVTLPDGVANPDNISLDVTTSVTVDAAVPRDKTLVEITAPAAITGIANGTAKTAVDLGLPDTVELVTDDGNVQAEINWNVAGSSYDPAITTEQTFTVNGTVTVPDGVVNPDNISLGVTISVTVDAVVPKDKILVEVTAPAAITGVANGTAKTAADLGLPGAVTLVTDDGNVQAEVVWNVAGSSYDPAITTEQTFTVNGIVTLPDGVTNPDNISLDVTISVTVGAAVPKDKTLVEITAPAAITGVANGTAKTVSALGLPGTVELVTDDGNVQAEVNWDVASSSYDPSIATEQTFTVNGIVTLPDGVVNPDSISLDVTISVTVDAAVPKDKTLLGITAPAAITGVANGTAKTAADLGLPGAVTLVTDDGNVQAEINWNVAPCSYDPSITTEQTFTVNGTVTLPDGVVNPDNISLDATVSVTVDAAVPKDKTLVEITVPAAITGVANGTAKTASALGLPDTVELVTDDGNVQAKVNWDIATSSYDPAITTEQTFTVSGIVTLPAGVTNPNAVSLYTGVLVTVNARTQGGGSPGGGSDRADRGAGVTILPDMRPDQPVIAGISITPTAGGSGHSTAIILQQPVADAVAEALANAKARGKTANGIGVSINIDLPDTANPPDIVLPRDTLQTLISAGVRQLVINGVNVILTLNLEALQEIQRQSVGNVTIAIKPAKDLPGAAKKLIGTRPAYDVTISYVKNGKTENVVSLGKGSATLSIPYTPSADEAVGWLFGVYADGKGQAERIPDSAYDPNSGNVILDGNHFSIYGVGYTPPSGKYTDIADHWARDSADYAVGRGLFTGTSETTFSPNTAMDRGMTVTVLGRLAGADVSAYKTSSFSDVAAGKYYLPYVEWAYKKGIVSGIGHGEFAPERAITREELALILQNYAKATGYTLPAICRAAVFADNSSIGSSYEAAAGTMQQAGIMVGGTGNKFNPQAPATRAEFATMLHHYIRLTIDPATARGWAKDDAGQYHYYREGKSPTGWQTIDGVRYFFNTNGTLKTGWVRDGNNWRFYSGNKATTGWLNQGSGTNEKRYYFDANAVMVSGKWLMLEDKWYYFNTDGSLARNTTIDGYNVDESGVRKAK